MVKRKTFRNAASKVNTTPTESMPDTEFSADYAHGENNMKGLNRNSKQGREGREMRASKED